MKNAGKVSVALIFSWIGLILGISFLEAWLKFQAPGVTLPIGLGIGKLVFGAMNKVEWGLGFFIFLGLILDKSSHDYLFVGIIILLLLQTFWLLPQLNSRADAIIQGEVLPSSNLHIFYGGAEILKFIGLIVFGFKKMDLVKLNN